MKRELNSTQHPLSLGKVEQHEQNQRCGEFLCLLTTERGIPQTIQSKVEHASASSTSPMLQPATRNATFSQDAPGVQHSNTNTLISQFICGAGKRSERAEVLK